jgi:DUF971 family protein
MSGKPAPWPLEIRLLADRRHLVITFDTQESFSLSAAYLRVSSPSAEVRGHGARAHKLQVTGKEQVRLLAIEPLGHYAVRLRFDDGHDTGFYTWTYLYNLGRDQKE